MFFATTALPLAIRFKSTLIGFLGVAAVYSALDFYVWMCGLCYIVGFASESALDRCLLSSLFLLIGLLGGHVVGYPERIAFIGPLIPALNTLGSVIYFLALLIKTNVLYRSSSYWWMQVWMILSLITASAIGSIYHIEAIRNTAMVFTVLYIMDKTCDFVFRTIPSLPVAIFIISVFLWKFSLYLHQTPDILVSIFGLNG